MKNKYVSDEWNLNCTGHSHFEFVDVNVNNDNLLFIDPCLIENWDTNWAIKVKNIMYSFFNMFYKAYKENDNSLKLKLLSHAGELNCTRLGYGRGDNGKGNTAQGLINDFRPLEKLIHDIDTIGKPQDVPTLIPGFAEDGFSDLLTNILHGELNNFTLEQMRRYGIKPNGETEFYSWNCEKLDFELLISSCYIVNGIKLLLVPKQIVRKNYLFGASQYFERIILERIRDEDGWYDSKGNRISKREISKNLKNDSKNWMYDYVINYSKKHSDALNEYHTKLPFFYFEYGKPMTDEELDKVVYDKNMIKSA